MLTITVYGPGCMKCNMLADVAAQAIKTAGVKGEVRRVTDEKAIAAAGVVKTPGLAINGKLVSNGRIPSPRTIVELIGKAQKAA